MKGKTIKLIKNRSDIGAGTRGADMGIDAMEIAAINKGNQYFNEYEHIDVPTRNESIYEKSISPYGKRIDQVLEQCVDVAEIIKQTLQNDKFPIVFSGDHSSALGTISGIKAAFPEKILGVIWIDAHADIHSPYTTPSGNLHGMPLAAAMHLDNLECQVNRVESEVVSYWEQLKKVGSEEPKLQPEHLVYFGVRDTEDPEDQLIDRLGIRLFKVEDVRRKGVEVCVSQTATLLQACDYIYISFDVDSMDSERISSGTGTPVPAGFDPVEIKALLRGLVQIGKTVCFEVVEVNPLLDNRGNKMAEVAFDILQDVTKDIEAVNNS
ncbi:arginase [Sphingobacterium sp. UT-1RO-CII-1]|uniref:arginase n=1 Tax=Sphingobacterium sp. UT-1RO-CII-1 TaxID=2995225 RepID=UPI00227A4FCB|nr:arginase [Sphingobacterium sp. UT-1RO-CII-1]MCY4779817.1 arginase [Sphingobacterium sp. UT-1RO-CII-1]